MGRVSRRALLGAGLCALLFAGVATATVITRHVTLRAGQCLTLSKTRVCASRARTVTRTVSHASPPITITQPVKTVTNIVTTTAISTVTVTVPSGVPPPNTPAPTGSPITKDFSGNGDVTEAPFTTTVGETLSWTWQNTNGDFPTGMTIYDTSGSNFSLVDSDGQTTSGSTYLAAGTHTLETITIGNWTIHVGP